jgi:hypothetical protein
MDATQGLAAILRDARKGRAPQDEVGDIFRASKPGDPVFRGVSDGDEKPQRTGYSAFAEYDGLREE